MVPRTSPNETGPDRHAAKRLAALPHPLHYETRRSKVTALHPDRF